MNAQAFGLDPAQVRRAFERAAATGGDAAVLQREVERRMFERLDTSAAGRIACSTPAAASDTA